MRKKKLACPKCRSTSFEIYLVTIPNFFPSLLEKEPSLTYDLARCTNCGWESLPTRKDKLRKLVLSVLRGEVPKKGFVLAEGGE